MPLGLSKIRSHSLVLRADALSFSLDSGKKIACQRDQDVNLKAHFPSMPELARCIKCSCNEGFIECERTAPVCPSGQLQAPTGGRKSPLALGDRKRAPATPQPQPQPEHGQPSMQARVPANLGSRKSSQASSREPKEPAANHAALYKHHLARDSHAAKSNRQAPVASSLGRPGADTALGEPKPTRMTKTLKSAADESSSSHQKPSIERLAMPAGYNHMLALASHVAPRKIGPVTFSMLPNASSPEFSQHQEHVRRLAAPAGSSPMPADDPRHHEVAIAVFGPSWPSERRRKELMLLRRTSTTQAPSDEYADEDSDDEDEYDDASTPVDELSSDATTSEPPSTTTTTTTSTTTTTPTTTTTTPSEAATTLKPAVDKPTVISIDVIKPAVGETHNNNASHSNSVSDTQATSDPFSGVGYANNLSDPDKLAERDMEQIANETVFLVALGAELLVVGGIIVMMAVFLCYECDHDSGPSEPDEKPAKLASSQHDRLSSSCSLISCSASASGSASGSDLKSALNLSGGSAKLSATIITIPSSGGLLV